ncbi:hypothetical protein Desor_5517 [Desulfosporosinus orientis DSM 765]|uniref:Uncharacterized protein n=1 Tax=Desulfosporosinus orientis (strain ATCC 19365 / DSM 765 / NCIMB 8382 / VKM B-1628 / Singapore I) TaxID=768706 RepID=G7WHH0_DESOD|nr:hypothetical protein [Desulfosporosinus orientis]AET70891.1 hypothetical protein Desor_5517 [Desulfosporosinus orientis DSM 765]
MLRGRKCSTAFHICHLKLFMFWIIFLAVISIGAFNLRPMNDNTNDKNSEIPLLLSSGCTGIDYANVSLTLWFESPTIPEMIWTKKPTPDWRWVCKELKTASQQTAISLSGDDRVNKSQEKDLLKWYTTMAPIIEKAGGIIYFDERVPQVIDVAGFLSKENTKPAQWILTDNLMSVAAYQDNLKTSVLAGKDRVNIQLVSRRDSNNGQTVLAIPVLLNEF